MSRFLIGIGLSHLINPYPKNMKNMKNMTTLLVGILYFLDLNAAPPRVVQVNKYFYEIDSPGGGRFAVEKTHDLKTWITRQFVEFTVDRGHINNWIFDRAKTMGAVRVKKTNTTTKDLKKEWSDRKINKYKFHYRQFGSSKTDSFFILEGDVTVKNEKIIKVEKIDFLNDGNIRPPIKPDITDFRTIRQIYDFFEKEKKDSEENTILISEDLSHPFWFSIDRHIDMVDDELYISIENFEILEE